MAKINGTDVLLYADGSLIACQTSCTVNFDQNLPDATCKDDAGWASHINGTRSATIDLDAIYSTTGVSAEELITYITGRSSLLLVCNGLGVPIVAEVDPSSVSMTAATEEAVTVTGSFTAQGGAYILLGGSAQLISQFSNGDYDTFTTSGVAISSAINSASTAYANSDAIDLADEDVVKVFTFLTLNSGEAPYVELVASAGGAAVSNQVQLTAGVNVVTLTATATDSTSYLELTNTAASNYALSNTYVFKV